MATAQQAARIPTRTIIDPLVWRDNAACKDKDPDIFYPESENSPYVQIAKAVCSVCPAQGNCLRYALQNNEHIGIWGGLTERERRNRRRRLRKESAA